MTRERIAEWVGPVAVSIKSAMPKNAGEWICAAIIGLAGCVWVALTFWGK